jgi:plasmid stabilization system protein ParE
MKSGYRVLWTDHALGELEKAVEYLQLNFTDVEIAHLARAIESTLSHITRNPSMYPESAKANGIRRAVILRFNTLYYRVNRDEKQVEILSFFSNRQDPNLHEL